ncbi:MAG: hypothetical protein NWE76_10085, partial [Candidatus Bathyarchaeota archaeon]|nr:hypothetical protein [Candidatus Bathyarchaeota archaeon]
YVKNGGLNSMPSELMEEVLGNQLQPIVDGGTPPLIQALMDEGLSGMTKEFIDELHESALLMSPLFAMNIASANTVNAYSRAVGGKHLSLMEDIYKASDSEFNEKKKEFLERASKLRKREKADSAAAVIEHREQWQKNEWGDVGRKSFRQHMKWYAKEKSNAGAIIEALRYDNEVDPEAAVDRIFASVEALDVRDWALSHVRLYEKWKKKRDKGDAEALKHDTYGQAIDQATQRADEIWGELKVKEAIPSLKKTPEEYRSEINTLFLPDVVKKQLRKRVSDVKAFLDVMQDINERVSSSGEKQGSWSINVGGWNISVNEEGELAFVDTQAGVEYLGREKGATIGRYTSDNVPADRLGMAVRGSINSIPLFFMPNVISALRKAKVFAEDAELADSIKKNLLERIGGIRTRSGIVVRSAESLNGLASAARAVTLLPTKEPGKIKTDLTVAIVENLKSSVKAADTQEKQLAVAQGIMREAVRLAITGYVDVKMFSDAYTKLMSNKRPKDVNKDDIVDKASEAGKREGGTDEDIAVTIYSMVAEGASTSTIPNGNSKVTDEMWQEAVESRKNYDIIDEALTGILENLQGRGAAGAYEWYRFFRDMMYHAPFDRIMPGFAIHLVDINSPESISDYRKKRISAATKFLSAVSEQEVDESEAAEIVDDQIDQVKSGSRAFYMPAENSITFSLSDFAGFLGFRAMFEELTHAMHVSVAKGDTKIWGRGREYGDKSTEEVDGGLRALWDQHETSAIGFFTEEVTEEEKALREEFLADLLEKALSMVKSPADKGNESVDREIRKRAEEQAKEMMDVDTLDRWKRSKIGL